MAGQGGQIGPGMQGQGHTGGRMRNTAANLYSKNTIDYQNPGGLAALPATTPEQTANYYSQLGGLYAQYQATLTGYKQQRLQARGAFQQKRAGIKSEMISGLASAENDAADRGVLGSSADLQGRVAVRADAAAQKQTAKGEFLQTAATTRLGAQQAGIDYFMGQQGLQAQQLAQQQQALAYQLQNNLIVSGQEQQADVLAQIYAALSANSNSGGNKKNTRGLSPSGLPWGSAAPVIAPHGANPGSGSQGGMGYVHGGRT